ncbi:MAG: carotenoid 1,2-hydratase [Candidatus Margulisbacteria bacterium]|nr:carotenoid 1,2-hydratase [Candidatus Margulisiibacteriota bacterium]MBU1021613.1 carotenoid 1,2-hydratase [Candidatus Margulisiibacteriota bacterium]MBU1728764.1 carotenoid 1,2-hydratase [Candidatus Margulisiibacteriota bacterium]MBU1955730.1 carotenoid 1,2-hydratase [Candidatus Margulisiibacteriota bacterium]
MKKLIVCLILLVMLASGVAAADEAKIENDIRNVLWLPSSAPLPASIKAKLKNNITDAGQRMAKMFNMLEKHWLPLVPRYPERYALFKKISAKGLTPIQMIRMVNFTGPDYFYGFKTIDDKKKLIFPQDLGADLAYQFGWVFFVGNLKDAAGNDYGIECVVFRRAMIAPPFAKAMDLSLMDNQISELQYAVSFGDKNLQVQGRSAVIAGSTGLIKYQADPFLVAVGKNKAWSLQKGALFPMKLQWNDPNIPMKVEMTMHSAKPILYQGDQGKTPDIYGLGCWYYSIPHIMADGVITYKGKAIKVKGKMWMDNQWVAGLMPIGYVPNLYIRALSNTINYFTGKSEEYGWDWYCIQLDDDTEITVAAPHEGGEDIDNKGPNPPPNMTKACEGKYVDKNGVPSELKGTLTITDWILSKRSHCWTPNGWTFSFPSLDITFTMKPIVHNQLLYFASSAEYREGATRVVGKRGNKKLTGYGFAEGVNYVGHDWYFTQNFATLGIKDTPVNRLLMTTKPISFWMMIKSVLVLISPFVLLLVLIVFIWRWIRSRKK